jgi:hypothetical protein
MERGWFESSNLFCFQRNSANPFLFLITPQGFIVLNRKRSNPAFGFIINAIELFEAF